MRADDFDPSTVKTYAFPISVGALADSTQTWASPKFDVMTEPEYQVHEQMHAIGAQRLRWIFTRMFERLDSADVLDANDAPASATDESTKL